MSDHKAEAERLSADNSPVHAHEMGGLATQMQGLVQATLYAAEQTAELVAQQKLANQMTYMESLATVMRDGYILSEDRRNDMATLDAAIREGLGLA